MNTTHQLSDVILIKYHVLHISTILQLSWIQQGEPIIQLIQGEFAWLKEATYSCRQPTCAYYCRRNLEFYSTSGVLIFKWPRAYQRRCSPSKPTFKKHHQLLQTMISPSNTACFPQNKSPSCSPSHSLFGDTKLSSSLLVIWAQWAFKVQLFFVSCFVNAFSFISWTPDARVGSLDSSSWPSSMDTELASWLFAVLARWPFKGQLLLVLFMGVFSLDPCA